MGIHLQSFSLSSSLSHSCSHIHSHINAPTHTSAHTRTHSHPHTHTHTYRHSHTIFSFIILFPTAAIKTNKISSEPLRREKKNVAAVDLKKNSVSPKNFLLSFDFSFLDVSNKRGEKEY